MAFRFRSSSEPSIFSLMAPNFDLVEFVIFPGRDDVMVQKYTLKLAGGRSWHAPDGRPSHPSTEKARAIWQELRTLGYRPRSEYNGL